MIGHLYDYYIYYQSFGWFLQEILYSCTSKLFRKLGSSKNSLIVSLMLLFYLHFTLPEEVDWDWNWLAQELQKLLEIMRVLQYVTVAR